MLRLAKQLRGLGDLDDAPVRHIGEALNTAYVALEEQNSSLERMLAGTTSGRGNARMSSPLSA